MTSNKRTASESLSPAPANKKSVKMDTTVSKIEAEYASIKNMLTTLMAASAKQPTAARIDKADLAIIGSNMKTEIRVAVKEQIAPLSVEVKAIGQQTTKLAVRMDALEQNGGGKSETIYDRMLEASKILNIGPFDLPSDSSSPSSAEDMDAAADAFARRVIFETMGFRPGSVVEPTAVVHTTHTRRELVSENGRDMNRAVTRNYAKVLFTSYKAKKEIVFQGRSLHGSGINLEIEVPRIADCQKQWSEAGNYMYRIRRGRPCQFRKDVTIDGIQLDVRPRDNPTLGWIRLPWDSVALHYNAEWLDKFLAEGPKADKPAETAQQKEERRQRESDDAAEANDALEMDVADDAGQNMTGMRDRGNAAAAVGKRSSIASSSDQSLSKVQKTSAANLSTRPTASLSTNPPAPSSSGSSIISALSTAASTVTNSISGRGASQQ